MTAMSTDELHRVLDTVRTGDEGTVTITRPGYVGVYTGVFAVDGKQVTIDARPPLTTRYLDAALGDALTHVEVTQRKVTLPTEPGTVVEADTEAVGERRLFTRSAVGKWASWSGAHDESELIDPIVQRPVPADQADALIAEAREVLAYHGTGSRSRLLAQRVLDTFGVTE